jgi:hypothetical protein
MQKMRKTHFSDALKKGFVRGNYYVEGDNTVLVYEEYPRHVENKGFVAGKGITGDYRLGRIVDEPENSRQTTVIVKTFS